MKLYRAGYCNLRALLMYLVIYGHLIEGRLGESPALQAQYRWIYAVHMPAFAFLSGLFCKQPESCRRQAGRALSVYLTAQLAAVALLDQTPWTPYWHLWYLLSLSMWGWSCWAWRRRWIIRWYFVLLAGLAGCLAGYLPFLGRGLSASRTLVFFPYFLAGVCCPVETDWRQLRPWGLAGLALAGVLLWLVDIPLPFLYQAGPYARPSGGLLRLACYGLGGCLVLFLLTAVPDRPLPISWMGADTLGVYLFHGPMILLLRRLPLPLPAFLALSPLLSAGVMCSLSTLTTRRSAKINMVNAAELTGKPPPTNQKG